jgi:hypothetical protein
MNRRETWYFLVALLLVGGIWYYLKTDNANSPSANTKLTPTLKALWTIPAGSVQSVTFKDLKTGKYVELESNAGKWYLANYALITPTLTPTLTSTPLPTLAVGVTPTALPSPTETATSTSTLPPTATLAESLTPTLPPTKEADTQTWPYLLSYLENLYPIQVVGEDLKPKDFGLDVPHYQLTLHTSDGKDTILLIGASTPVKGAGYYAQVSGEKAIVLLPADMVDTLVGFLSAPPVVQTPTQTATEVASIAPTATPSPSLTPTATVALPSNTPEATASAS